MTTDSEYSELLTERILAILLANETIEFSELITRLEGADPSLVKAIVEGNENIRPRIRWTPLRDQQVRREAHLTPHPLDYDWRFTKDTIAMICKELANHREIGLMGAPSLWQELQSVSAKGTLFDLNASKYANEAQSRSARNCDLVRDVIPAEAGQYDAAFADPPWYPEATNAFLWNAARILRPGGSLFLSVPPKLTRPGIAAERHALSAWIAKLGLTHIRTNENLLTYEMPPFERNTLAKVGLLTFVPRTWRAGDLVVLRKESETSEPFTTSSPVDGVWVERTLGGVRLRIRTDVPDEEAGGAHLASIVEGNVLATVSRRDGRRANVRIWTSGNRAFGCLAPTAFLRILDEGMAGTLHRPQEVEIYLSVQQLVELEQNEYLSC